MLHRHYRAELASHQPAPQRLLLLLLEFPGRQRHRQQSPSAALKDPPLEHE
jgi:hypothetical protein